MAYKFFDKKTAGSGIKSVQQNGNLAKELHKPIIKKFRKRIYLGCWFIRCAINKQT